MKQVLINEITKPTIDIPKLIKLIENGKPYKFLGFIDSGFEDIGLFETYKGLNIFHYLAYKGELSKVLPTFFGGKSQDILQREKASLTKLQECLRAVTPSELTPAHIAVVYNPTALQILHQYGVGLTSKAYSATLQQNGNKAVAFAPVEYIFKDEATAHKFLTENIRAGCTDIFKILNKEDPKIRKELLEYFPYIVEEVKKINSVNSNKVFTMLFQDYWPDILVADHSSFTKVMRLMNILSDRSKKWNLSIEDWAQLLRAEHFENLDEIRQYILSKFASKFLDGTLSSVQLGDLINLIAIDDSKFQQLKDYFIEGDSSIVNPAEASVLEIVVDQKALGGANESQVGLSAASTSTSSIVDKNVQQVSVSKKLDGAGVQGAGAVSAANLSLAPQSASKSLVKPKLAVKVASIQEYAKTVTTCLQGSKKCTEHIQLDLGTKYTQLHSFISMLALPGDFFGKVLLAAAQKLNVDPKNTGDFLIEYIGTVQINDLVTTDNSKKLSAYGLACARDQLDLAKLLLSKGLELGIYSGGVTTIFEMPIRYNSTNIMEYLLNKQSAIAIDWRYILSQAIKYANAKAIQYYINSESDLVKDITDRSGALKEDGKYNVLNKALDGLTELLELKRFPEAAKREAAVKKISKLSECIKILIEADKVYYAEENWTVSKKRFSLLKELKIATKVLSQDSSLTDVVQTINSVKNLVISHYDKCELTLTARQLVEKLKSSADEDTASNATMLTHFSALSDLGRAGQFDDRHELSDALGQGYAQDDEDKENVVHVAALSSIGTQSSSASSLGAHVNHIGKNAATLDTGLLNAAAISVQSANSALLLAGDAYDSHE